jgi:hypothetical protein
LEEEYNRRDLLSAENRAGFVNNMLGNENEINRPFLWQTTDDIDWQGARDNLQVRLLAPFFVSITSDYIVLYILGSFPRPFGT